jgi:hypothetical protein
VILLLSALSLAQEPPQPPEPEPDPPVELPPIENEEPGLFEPGRWAVSPYVDPVGGISLWGGSGNRSLLFNLGAEGGISYTDRQTLLAGKTRARGSVVLASGLAGHDVRMGTFLGPVSDSWGVEFPIVATLGPPQLTFLAGVSTSWLANPARRVNWDQAAGFGFGHEFSWRLGLMINAGPVHFGVSYSRRQTAIGPQQGFGLTLGF